MWRTFDPAHFESHPGVEDKHPEPSHTSDLANLLYHCALIDVLVIPRIISVEAAFVALFLFFLKRRSSRGFEILPTWRPHLSACLWNS